jgi:membrane protease YdiL (CAAX protease family)
MKLSELIKKHQLASYFLLTYLLTWAIALPNVAKAQGWFDLGLPMAWHYLTAYGPLLAAIVVIWAVQGKDGLKTYWRNLTKWRDIPLLTWVVAFSLLIIFGIGYGIWFGVGGAPDLSDVGNINFLKNIGLWALPLWVLTSGLGEEGGWRGFALPKLRERFGPIKSSLIIWFFWSLWHVFAFLYLPNYANLGWAVIGFFLGILAGSIVFTWIWENSNNSLVPAILFHGFLNFTTASRISDQIIAPVITMFIMVLAVGMAYGFARKQKK